MGTLGHFPLNARVLDTIYNLLKFGGRVYLDERIATKTFMSHVFTDSHCLLNLNRFLDGLTKAGSRSWRFITTAGAIISPSDNGRGILRRTKATCSAHSATSHAEGFAFYLWGAPYAFLARKFDCY